MKVSIITVTYNSGKYLEQTILSIKNQTHKDFEYIIIDGGSTDNTLEIINNYSNIVSYWISEKDDGIYNAMNKGIKQATGDIIGFLNSDDIFFDNNVLKLLTETFNENIECVFGDIVFVDNDNTSNITRLYSAKNFTLKMFLFGHMPPHPSFYALKTVYNKVGFFKEDYKIAADFDYLVRVFLLHSVKFKYINSTMVRMRVGGVSSTIKNKILLNKEIYRSCRENNLKTNFLKIYSKYIFKVLSFLIK